MAERERVRLAIDEPVEAAGKLRQGMPEGALEARLVAVIDGWGRGLAGGLEELAVAIGDVRRLTLESGANARSAPAAPGSEPKTDNISADTEAERREERPEFETETIEELRARAAASRQKTHALRQDDSADGDKTDPDQR